MRAWIPAVVLGLVTAPNVARACSTINLPSGLSVYSPEQRTIASDGVLGFDAFVLGPDVADVTATLELEVLRDGVPVAGSVEFLELYAGPTIFASPPHADAELLHQFLIVWRPAEPLAPGLLTGEIAADGFPPTGTRFEVTVTDTPAPPLTAPKFLSIMGDEVVTDVYEKLCCETGLDSCGGETLCTATEVRHAPAFRMSAALPAGQQARAYLWAMPVLDGQAGARIPSHEPIPYNFDEPLWSRWSTQFPLRFDVAASEYCVILGATSLIDGTSVASEPHCEPLQPPRDVSLTPTLPPDDADGLPDECLTPPILVPGDASADDAPEHSPSGCRLAADPRGALLLPCLWLLRPHRRRDA